MMRIRVNEKKENIAQVASRMIALSKKKRKVIKAKFYGIELTAKPYRTTVDEIVSQYMNR